MELNNIQLEDLVKSLLKNSIKQNETISSLKHKLALIQNVINSEPIITREGKIQSYE